MSVTVLYAQHQSRFVFTSVAVDAAVSQEAICNFEHSRNTELVPCMNHCEEEVSVVRSLQVHVRTVKCLSHRTATFTAPSRVVHLPRHHVVHLGILQYAVRKRDNIC